MEPLQLDMLCTQGCSVQSWPFKDMHYHGSNRRDFVFIRPPGIEEGGFTLRPDNVWYCKVLLLFSIQAQTDQNCSTEEFQCAFVSVLEPLADRSPNLSKELLKHGSLVLYELDPKVPLVYVVPIQSRLGKLPLVPVGDTGTIRLSTEIFKNGHKFRASNSPISRL